MSQSRQKSAIPDAGRVLFEDTVKIVGKAKEVWQTIRCCDELMRRADATIDRTGGEENSAALIEGELWNGS
ncbi:hypothetical protein PHSY_007141 [Pseudozyma hubeiensis SY62]|uniref:Uncharacterized protein n=1 Tax=Pseudozyma hubeiensis (strain SY62) TaxID=1305764 RepID=R9PDU2_PSEHS|nr:hypothetical protein PHSY_007141 [Pseudozyma hubeiensis SY62]GAC99539.1 hypothetical protein PHSY_007141 [Pseudozyma hubeiensis SY62]